MVFPENPFMQAQNLQLKVNESMAYELEPHGIKVVLVEPGVIRTSFYNSRVVARKS